MERVVQHGLGNIYPRYRYQWGSHLWIAGLFIFATQKAKGKLIAKGETLEQRDQLISKWFQVGDYQIHTRLSASQNRTDAEPIVLVHGLGVSTRYMVPLAERLSSHYRVYAPDLPGFGKSSKPPFVLNLHELSDVLALWMAAVELDKAVLLGNSFGCQIIVDLALRHQQRISSAILVGPTVDPSRRGTVQLVYWIINSWREPPTQGLNTALDYKDCGLQRLGRTFQHALADKLEEKLPRVEAPTLIVRGSRDLVVSPWWAEYAARLLPNGRLVTIPGVAHVVNYSDPARLSLVVRQYLTHIRH